MTTATTILVTGAAVGAGVVGGVFYAFSTFVMPGLRRLPPEQGIAAMQQLNVTAVRPGLMIALFGTGAVCLAATVVGLVRGVDRRSVLVLIGSACYLIGAIGVTAGVNVPLNDALASVDPTSGAAAETWRDFAQRWTTGNHVRTALSIVGTVLLTASLLSTSES